MTGGRFGLRAAILAAATLAAFPGCGGAGDGDPWEDIPVVIPPQDPGGPRDVANADPGRPDPGTADALPDGPPGDPGVSLDPGVPGDGTASDPGAVDPGAPADPGAADLPPADLPEIQVGFCAPGQADCRCDNDGDCDGSYHRTCLPNVCDLAVHRCFLDPNRLDGTGCNDGDSCTDGDACGDGACLPGAFTCECRQADDCDDANPCTDDTCVDNACSHAANSASCDDGEGCTDGDRCIGGTCRPGTRICECDGADDCDDDNPCTLDTCDAGGTCANAAANGPCEDGNPCTVDDTCQGGTCVPGTRVCECQTVAECNDGDPCTDDACVSNACRHVPNTASCNDGDSCTTGDRCDGAGNCVGGTITCARCPDKFCFKPAETCSSCPQDCGTCPAKETACLDGYDDDGDGATDCDDGDCAALADCRTQTCFNWFEAGCGLTDSRRASGGSVTGSLGGKCNNYELKIGSQTSLYRFRRPTTGSVTVRCDLPRDQPYHLYVLEAVCNALNCFAYDRASATDTRTQVTFTAQANRDYYIVVHDGANNINYYDLTITCQ